METICATLACCLLAVFFSKAQTEYRDLTMVPTTTPDLNLTHTTIVTSSNSAVNATTVSNLTVDTTPFNSTTWHNETLTETTGHPQTSQSTTILTTLINNSSLTATTPATHTSSFTAVSITAIQTTAGYISTPDTSAITTANSSHTVTTLDSVDTITQGFGLNISEKNMTIVFSVALGVFVVVLVMFMFYRCKVKIQFLHQPLNNTNDTEAFGADDDTLVISGGLYDGHPIYDNIPTPPEDQSQFRLEFLH